MPDLAYLSVPEIKPREYAQIKNFAFATFGLELRQGREKLVSARLGKHIRAGGFQSFAEYFRHVQSDRTGEALITLIDALTTNHTSFLREREHFTFLAERVIPEFQPRGPLSIWSAACSTGEEPYSVLFSALDAGLAQPDLRLSATDISTKALNAARAGVYTADKVQGLPPTWLRQYFDLQRRGAENAYQVRPEFRSRVEFFRFNLMHPIPAGRRYHVIFCRNVMIYFSRPTQAGLVNRLAACLEPGGYLLVGHAESLTGVDHPLKYVKPAVYRRMK